MIVFDTIDGARAGAGKNREFPNNPKHLGGGRVARGTNDIASFKLPGQTRTYFRSIADVPANIRAHFGIE